MGTIFSYVESVFQNLPRTAAMKRLKEDMLHNMEEKYLDLKADGASEQAAIGTVLSEFGNIDEIIEEYELNLEEEPVEEIEEEENDPDMVVLSQEQVNEWFEHRNRYSFGIALGVSLCILGVVAMLSTMLLFQNYGEGANILGVAVLLFFVAIGVSLLIIFGLKESRYHYDAKYFRVDVRTHAATKEAYDEFQRSFPIAITAGVILCILGVVVLLLTLVITGGSGLLGVIFLLAFIATGVFILVHYGILNSTYQKILQIGEYSRSKVKAAKLSEQLASIIFPLATLFYLYMGFIHGQWGRAWIIFPIVAVAFGILSSIIESLASFNKRR